MKQDNLHFLDYLLSLGYEPWKSTSVYQDMNSAHRHSVNFILERYNTTFISGNSTQGNFIWQDGDSHHHFSTMGTGYMHRLWIKNKDYDNMIVWGLHEKDYPAILISPRPIIDIASVNHKGLIFKEQQSRDKYMFRCLQNETNEDIYKAMFDRTKRFTYKHD